MFWCLELFGRNFPPLRRGKGCNRNLTGNWVAYAKLPCSFPNFPKFCPISEKILSSIGFLWVASKILTRRIFSRGQNFVKFRCCYLQYINCFKLTNLKKQMAEKRRQKELEEITLCPLKHEVNLKMYGRDKKGNPLEGYYCPYCRKYYLLPKKRQTQNS